jgi:hypothetical protein
MKYLTFLLACTIVILTVNPCMDTFLQLADKEQSCCGGTCSLNINVENSIETPVENDDCEGKTCNPFQVCGNCLFYNFVNPLGNIIHTEISTEHNFSYSSTFKSQFKPDFWQPPKIA